MTKDLKCLTSGNSTWGTISTKTQKALQETKETAENTEQTIKPGPRTSVLKLDALDVAFNMRCNLLIGSNIGTSFFDVNKSGISRKERKHYRGKHENIVFLDSATDKHYNGHECFKQERNMFNYFNFGPRFRNNVVTTGLSVANS